MSNIKTPSEQAFMRTACRASARVLGAVTKQARPGITTRELDDYAAECIDKIGGQSAFLGYKGFPRHSCISVNDEVVHGIGSEREIEFGDIVSIDIGVEIDGFIGDNAKTVIVGECDIKTQKLIEVTEASLYAGISCAVAGNRVSDISRAIQDLVESSGFSVVREFVGHGVGRTMHEDPQVPNFVEPRKKSAELRPGMTLAIEPMVNAGKAAVKVLRDGWTVVTRDGRPSVHFEHTILVRDGEAEVLTCLEETKYGLNAV